MVTSISHKRTVPGARHAADCARLASRDSLITTYHTYVHALVGQMVQRMHLPTQAYDEYISAGYMGLVEAAERYDRRSGVDFRSYAYLRIRGAVIDSIRAHSQLSGRAYRYARAMQAVQDLREVDMAEGAQRAGLPDNKNMRLSRLLEFAAQGALAYRLVFDEAQADLMVHSPATAVTPEEQIIDIQERREFRRLLATLPEKERIVVEGYYFQGKSFTQIADEYRGLSKSWVSRIHSRALRRLREKLEEHPV